MSLQSSLLFVLRWGAIEKRTARVRPHLPVAGKITIEDRVAGGLPSVRIYGEKRTARVRLHLPVAGVSRPNLSVTIALTPTPKAVAIKYPDRPDTTDQALGFAITPVG